MQQHNVFAGRFSSTWRYENDNFSIKVIYIQKFVEIGNFVAVSNAREHIRLVACITLKMPQKLPLETECSSKIHKYGYVHSLPKSTSKNQGQMNTVIELVFTTWKIQNSICHLNAIFKYFWTIEGIWTFKWWGLKTYVFESWTFNSPGLLKYGIN